MRLVSTAILAIALVGTGCGASEDTPVATSDGKIVVEAGPVTKAEFVKQANRICQDAKNRFLREYAAFVKSQGSPSGDQEGQATTVVGTMLVPAYDGLIQEMTSTVAPSADTDEIAAFLTTLQRELDFAEQHPTKALASRDLFRQASDRAAAYGLAVCVETLG
jgi:hypothetical protein